MVMNEFRVPQICKMKACFVCIKFKIVLPQSPSKILLPICPLFTLAFVCRSDSADSAEEMRLMALNVLLKLYDEEYGIEKCTEVMKLLTSSDDLSKKRYFNDSAFHRIKHKKLQLLLIFETILYKKLSSSEKVGRRS